MTRAVFSLVVLVVAIALIAGLRRAGAGVRPVLAILFAYVAIPGHLARTGAVRPVYDVGGGLAPGLVRPQDGDDTDTRQARCAQAASRSWA